MGVRVRAEASGYFIAGDIGQPKITEYEVEVLLLGDGEPVTTGVHDCHVVASAFQQGLVSSGQVNVVFDDESTQCRLGLGGSEEARRGERGELVRGSWTRNSAPVAGPSLCAETVPL